MSTTPFHEAKLDDTGPVTLQFGQLYTLKSDRRVEVWQVKERDGLCIRIFRPTADGKTSDLTFGLSSDAAAALLLGLKAHLEPV